MRMKHVQVALALQVNVSLLSVQMEVPVTMTETARVVSVATLQSQETRVCFTSRLFHILSIANI